MVEALVRRVIITISGRPGSGKSTVARAVASRAGMDHVSAGEFMRQIAVARRMSVLTLSAIAETDGGGIDKEIDARSARLGEERDNFVIDARLAWHFIPGSVKIFLDVSIEVAAARIFGDSRGGETENVDLGSTRSAVESRLESETRRYQAYYGIDWSDPAHFDLVVDTTALSIADVVDRVSDYLASLRS